MDLVTLLGAAVCWLNSVSGGPAILGGVGPGHDFAADPIPCRTPSKFRGHWNGSWSGSSDIGTVDFRISRSGRISGTFVNTSTGSRGTIMGSVDTVGYFTGFVRYRSPNSLVRNGMYTEITATITRTNRGRNAVGSFTQHIFDSDLGGSFSLAKQQ